MRTFLVMSRLSVTGTDYMFEMDYQPYARKPHVIRRMFGGCEVAQACKNTRIKVGPRRSNIILACRFLLTQNSVFFNIKPREL